MAFGGNDPNTPYNGSVFLTSHNSFCNKADKWPYPNQTKSMQDQLREGIRAFMLDLWYAPDQNGKYQLLISHGYPSTKGFKYLTLEEALKIFTAFLHADRKEVVTVFLETGNGMGALTPSQKTDAIRAVRKILKSASFRPYVFDPAVQADGYFTKLKDLSKRLFIFSDWRGDDTHSQRGKDRLGLPLTWHWFYESVYGHASLQSATYGDQRAESKDSKSAFRTMALVNHFPDSPALSRLYGGYDAINAPKKLEQQVFSFFSKQGILPNFVALDFYEKPSDPAHPFGTAVVDYIRKYTTTVSNLNGASMSNYSATLNGPFGIGTEMILAPGGSGAAKMVLIADPTLKYCLIGVRDSDQKLLWLNYNSTSASAFLTDTPGVFERTDYYQLNGVFGFDLLVPGKAGRMLTTRNNLAGPIQILSDPVTQPSWIQQPAQAN